MKYKSRRLSFDNKIKTAICFLIVLFSVSLRTTKAQTGIDEIKGSNPSTNRARGLRMLKDIKELIKSEYYDSKFHGINLDKRFDTAAEKIKTLNANWEIYTEIASILLEFNDSHTRFVPPFRTHYVEYGFAMQMIGNDCYIVNVKKGSDAAAKQLRAGDAILKIGTYQPTRENLWMLNYLIYTLDPQPGLSLTVQGLDGKQRSVAVEANLISFEEKRKQKKKRHSEKTELAYKCVEINSDSIACKLYSFSVDKETINKMMNEVGQHKNFVLDLRGNKGGYVNTELYLTGYFFDRDVKIGDEKTRNKIKERIAKSIKGKVYNGNLAVLIDSESASASEVFARVVQIEKRGKIVGDQSAGAVMTGNFIGMADVREVADVTVRQKVDSFYAINLTVGDLIMTDGSRLEGFGVVPDFRIGPTALAISQKSDPILAYAASLFGTKISPEQAGKFQFLTDVDEDNKNIDDDSNEIKSK
jgi:carboxyl-terminal processing protease